MGNASGKSGGKKKAAGAQEEVERKDTFGTGNDSLSRVERLGRGDRGNRVKKQVITGSLSDVRAKYDIEQKELGHGHYGVVRKCFNKESGECFAIKSIKKSRVNRINSLKREIEILQTVDHPNIIKLYDVYEDEKYIHLVTEICTGGELFDRIIAKTKGSDGRYSERDAATIVHSILKAIAYCHDEKHICHRDLKPENFLFKTEDEDSEIKIIDFGLSRFEDNKEVMTTRVGTPYYIAPEVLSRRYDSACDMWSVGVITYILLCGYPPFFGDNDQEIFASVRRGEFDFPSPEWDNISKEACNFIRSLLLKNPGQRLTASAGLTHRWFRILNEPKPPRGESDGTAQINFSKNVNLRLREFSGLNRLKRVARNVIAEFLTEAEIGHLRKVFQAIDVDGNGVITLDELRDAMREEGLEDIESEVLRIMTNIDIDGSNTLDYREFLAATAEANVFIREENIKKAFEYFDKDSNGHITMANLIAIFGSEDHAKEVMDIVDTNGDKIISFDEFETMMKTEKKSLFAGKGGGKGGGRGGMGWADAKGGGRVSDHDDK